MAGQRPKVTNGPSSLDSTRQMLDELDALMERMLASPPAVAAAERDEESDPSASALEVVRPPVETVPTRKPSPPRPRLREVKKPTSGDETFVEALRVKVEVPTPENAGAPGSRITPDPESRLRELLDLISQRSAPLENASSSPAAPAAALAEPELVQESPRELPRDTSDATFQGNVEPSDRPAGPESDATPSTSAKDAVIWHPAAAPEPVSIAPAAPALSNVARFPLLAVNYAFDGFSYLLGPMGSWMRTPVGRIILGYVGVALLLFSGLWLLRDWFGWPPSFSGYRMFE